LKEPQQKLTISGWAAQRNRFKLLIESGVNQTKAAEQVGISRVTSGKWFKELIDFGAEAFISRQADRMLALTSSQEQSIFNFIIEHAAWQLANRVQVWDVPAIIQLIDSIAHVQLSRQTILKYLTKWGFATEGFLARQESAIPELARAVIPAGGNPIGLKRLGITTPYSNFMEREALMALARTNRSILLVVQSGLSAYTPNDRGRKTPILLQSITTKHEFTFALIGAARRVHFDDYLVRLQEIYRQKRLLVVMTGSNWQVSEFEGFNHDQLVWFKNRRLRWFVGEPFEQRSSLSTTSAVPMEPSLGILDEGLTPNRQLQMALVAGANESEAGGSEG